MRAKGRVYTGLVNYAVYAYTKFAFWQNDSSCKIAMKITLTRNRQYGGSSSGSSKMPCLLVYLLLNVSYCSPPVTELLVTVMRRLDDCSRFYPHTTRNMAENFIVHCEVTVHSVHSVVVSLDRGAQANGQPLK